MADSKTTITYTHNSYRHRDLMVDTAGNNMKNNGAEMTIHNGQGQEVCKLDPDVANTLIAMAAKQDHQSVPHMYGSYFTSDFTFDAPANFIPNLCNRARVAR